MKRPAVPSMVRNRLLVAVVLAASASVASCESPGPDLVANAGEWNLSTDRLAELLVLAQPFPLDSAAAADLARHWVGVAAFVQRDASADLTGETATRAAIWLEEREALLDLDREDRLGSTVVVDRLVSEIAFRVGDVRLFAHVLRRAGPETPPRERELQRNTAQRILDELVAGGPWEAAVAETDDVDTRSMSGLLGLFAPGELPPDLERAAFALLPGQISAVVEASDGFHILYRPLFEDVTGLYASRLRQREIVETDAASRDVVLSRRGFAVANDAARTVRRLARDPWNAFESEEEVGTWDDGSLAASSVARHLVALPDVARAQLAVATDAELEDFALSVAIREIRLLDAGRRGIRLDPETMSELSEQHMAEVRKWRSALGGASRTQADRASVARYMEEVVARRVPAEPLSPLFEAWLLEGLSWEVQGRSVLEAIATARRMIAGTA